VLLQIFSWFWQWKNFENRSIFDELKAYQRNGAIFWTTLYMIILLFEN